MSGATKKRIVIALVAIIAGAATILLLTRPRDSSSSAQERVKIELRAKPVATIRMNGKALGKTPIVIVVPRGTKPIELEATFTIEKYGMTRPAKKTETWRQTRSVVPDAEQSVDFTLEDATRIDAHVGP